MSKNLRATAAIIIAKVAYSHQSLTQTFEQYAKALSGENASLVKALCFGTLRFFPRFEALMDNAMSRPIKKTEGELRALIAVGIYQLLDSRIPAHAAISETVDASLILKKKWAKGLVNALLRRVQREPEWCITQFNKTETAQYCFPEWLIKTIKKDWPETWRSVLEESNLQAPMVLRVNCNQSNPEKYKELLQELDIESTTHALAKDALVMAHPVNVEKLPGFFEGLVSIQDAAPQLSADFLDLKPNHRVLDACAAPGGKTGHILERQPSIHCVALDVDEIRLRKVENNLRRLGLKAQCIAADAAQLDTWWDGVLFDRILLDAPCSGTGVIRRHPDIKLLRNAADIQQTQLIQKALLEQLWKTLKPGGRLVYSTCSIIHQENEHQIVTFMKKHPDAEIIQPKSNLILSLQNEPPKDNLNAQLGWQIAPGWNQMDGFFYAILCKRSDEMPSFKVQQHSPTGEN